VARAGLRIDLYLPPEGGARPPLLVFALGGRWSMPDPSYARAAAIGDALQRRGVAAAVVRFALADGYPLDRCAEDVARAIAVMIDKGAAYGFDAGRVALGGYDLGAALMLKLGLDRGALGRAGVDAGRVKGVVGLRGLYDLSPEALSGHPQRSFYEWAAGAAPEGGRAASALAHARADAPPVLLLVAAKDLVGYAQGARQLVRALEEAGAPHAEMHTVPETDHDSVANLSGEGNPAGDLVAGFVRGDPAPGPIDGPWGARRRWSLRPPLSTRDFWTDPAASKLIRAHPVDDRLRADMGRAFTEQPYELNPWPGRVYHAIDLLAYLEARPEAEIGRGDFLVVTNLRGERLFWTRADLARHRPRLVVGLDDERNLYRIFASYRTRRQYSWLKDEPAALPRMIRPVGAFLHAPGELPARLRNTTLASFALSRTSFRWQKEDPLAPIRGLPPDVRDALTAGSACLSCHAFRGAGARSHHATAETAEPAGAFALALEEYPPAVLRDFLFEQDRVAALFGVRPLRVPGPTAARLHALVERERGPAGAERGASATPRSASKQ
jgi:acetyl esterase/lipase